MFIPDAATFNSRASALVRSPKAVICNPIPFRGMRDEGFCKRRGVFKTNANLMAQHIRPVFTLLGIRRRKLTRGVTA